MFINAEVELKQCIVVEIITDAMIGWTLVFNWIVSVRIMTFQKNTPCRIDKFCVVRCSN